MDSEDYNAFWDACVDDQIRIYHNGAECTLNVETLYQMFALRFRRENLSYDGRLVFKPITDEDPQ